MVKVRKFIPVIGAVHWFLRLHATHCNFIPAAQHLQALLK